jgi:hypothetical protein
MSVWDGPRITSTLEAPAAALGAIEEIELVGPHLRVKGTIALGMFHRLSDRLNHSRGYVQVHDAQLMRRNGDPTELKVEELMINPDEITFIAQRSAGPKGDGAGGGAGFGSMMARESRRYVFFTEGHTISGDVQVYGESDLASFVEASEPRFVPLVGARARSLADRRVISHYELLLLNRTRTTAVAEASRAASLAD